MKKVFMVLLLACLLCSSASAKDFTQDADCIGAWLLDETSGNAIDACGSNDGTVTGAAQGVAGEIGTAYAFDASGDYVDAGSAVAFDIASGTLMFWFMLNNLPDSTDRGPFAKDAAGNNNGDFSIHWGFISTDNKVTFYMSNGGSEFTIFSDNAQQAGVWYHFACVWGPDGMKMYINGVLQADTDAYTGGMTNTTPSVMIGSIRPNVFDFDGKIDEVGLFDRVLISSEINEIMVGGVSGNRTQIRGATVYGATIN